MHGFPFRQDDGNLDKGGGMDIKINSCSYGRGEKREEQKDKKKTSKHISFREKTDSDLKSIFVQFLGNGRQRICL